MAVFLCAAQTELHISKSKTTKMHFSKKKRDKRVWYAAISHLS